jgi:hypothetical protein
VVQQPDPVIPPTSIRSWRAVFRQSRLGEDYFAIRGSWQAHSGIVYPGDPVVDRLLVLAEERGFPSEHFSMGSPANASTYEIYVAYLDGGLLSYSGNFFGGAHGAWVWGRKVLALACADLGLQRPRFRELSADLSRDALLTEVRRQVETEDSLLRARLLEMRNHRYGIG